MRYEITIALRYLISKQSVREPTVIGLLTIAGLALSTGMMIVVLAVFAGFEGDLRDKILGTHAHILVTGPEEDVVKNPDPIVDAILEQPNVNGVSPFVESEVMIASTTNYSGMVVRGLNPRQKLPASNFQSYLIEGDMQWLNDSRQAFAVRDPARWDSDNPTFDEIDALQRQIEQTQQEIRKIREQADRGLDIHGEPLPKSASPRTEQAEKTTKNSALSRSEKENEALMPSLPDPPSKAEAARAGEDLMPDLPAPTTNDDEELMPSLPAPQHASRAVDEAENDAWDDDFLMPSLPPPRKGAKPSLPTTVVDDPTLPPLPDVPWDEDAQDSTASAFEEEDHPDLPGIIIGTELQDILNVLIGDTVNLITPDGDLGPNGLIPRSRPYRVVGVFYTGFYLYDSGMGVVDIDAARSLLNIGSDEVTGIEVRTPDLNNAHRVGEALGQQFAGMGLSELEVRDWRELNQSLFVALKIERMAMAAVLIFFIAISGLLVLLVVWMFVIEKRKEIAVLKAVGASRGNIMRIFLTQGVTMGIIGAGLGLLLALGFVGVAVYVGIPLNPDDYYIDRLPIEISAWEFVLVTLSALVVTVLATLLPALQAANLDPVTGLRDDQDNN